MPSDPSDFQSPKQFLRQRRPERFSDSKTAEIRGIDRGSLEYFLETLTNRNQESDFQNFALKLAEKVICPNLRPQTGPTGGGDSKADAESYTVADDLAFVWFTGQGRQSASERWAFAFSTKKEWQGKIKSDIAKIAKTKRGYTEAFFVSNQFIPDKKRSKIEDELKRKHKFERVTIHDRTWILNEVFKGGYQKLAIEELHIPVPPVLETETGPLDARRKKALDEAEEQIKAHLADRSADTRLVWDGIEAGRLARELELPRPQVDGRYQRAIDLADKYGTERQKTEARYQFAWTTFWWQEDFSKFADLYLEFERITKDSTDIGELRQLHNLWNLLSRVKASGEVPEEKLRWNDRTVILSGALERMTKAAEMPSAVLEARSMLLFMQAAFSYPNVPEGLFSQFKDIVTQSEAFIGFPLESTVELIGEFGELFPADKDYDELNETIADLLAKHDGETASAEKLLQRSFQKMDGGQDYDAIELAGRALSLLWKNETQKELIQGLYASAIAYERIGLLWAARGSLVNAASLMVNSYRRHNNPDELRASCFQRLKWIELFLGRLPESLAWYELEQATRSVQKNKPEPEEFFMYGAVIGLYFLRADLATLKKLERLPDALGSRGIHQARAALLFALGWEDKAKEEIGDQFGDDIEKMFLLWRDQPAIDDLPEQMRLGDEPVITLSSKLLGCDVRVIAQDKPACRLIGESVLSALESALATAYRERLIPMVRSIEISISEAESTLFPFSFEIADASAQLKCKIQCASFDPNNVVHEDQGKIKDGLRELIVQLSTHFVPVPDFLERFKRVFFENNGFGRAINFTGSIVTLGNVLGHTPSTKISDWMPETAHAYELKRTKSWDADSGVPRRERKEDGGLEAKPGSNNVRHQDMASLSIINNRLWEQAKWAGTMYLGAQNAIAPPFMCLGFEDTNAASEIFKGWRELFGEIDEDNEIRVVVVKGIKKSPPAAYRIMICGNIETARNKGKRHFVNMFRSNTMDTSDGTNLHRFLENFKQAKAFYLGFAKMRDMNSFPGRDEVIGKRDLVIREAWTIGPHDIDAPAIQPDDDPIIPPGAEATQINQLLAEVRSRRVES